MTIETKIKIVEIARKEGATEEQIERLCDVLWLESEKLPKPSYTTDITQNSSVDIAQIVSKTLRKLGVPAHILGYKYLRTAICACIENEPQSFTKELYPSIAKEYGSSASKVERAIRHAIDVAWERGTCDTFENIFGCSVSPEKGKPTNSEFISTIADRLKLEYDI